MSERDVSSSPSPRTRAAEGQRQPEARTANPAAGVALQTESTLLADLAALGVRFGGVLMVHSSLSRVGYVLGGAQTCVRALLRALGPEGTLVMPAFSGQVSDPADWPDLRFDAAFLELAREEVPVFHPETTPTAMGAIPETFRTWPGVLRGAHPQVSVCALGPRAAEIVEPHDWAWGEGAGTPFERLYAMDAQLLLLGVGFNRATLLHFAESRVPHGRRKVRRFPYVEPDGSRGWAEVPDVGDDLNTHFPAIGEAVHAKGLATVGRVGQAPCSLVSARILVDFATDYLSAALPAR
jgi:aminoglycoside 3-N-acetyltransferase